MGLTFGAALLIAVLAAIFRSEFEALAPFVAERVRRLALKRIPQKSLRERLDEEWKAYLDETPGFILKLVCSFGFLWAAYKIGASIAFNRLAYKGSFILVRVLIRTSSHIVRSAQWINSNVNGPSRHQSYLVLFITSFALRVLFFSLRIYTWRVCFIPDAKRRADAKEKAEEAVTDLLTKMELGIEEMLEKHGPT